MVEVPATDHLAGDPTDGQVSSTAQDKSGVTQPRGLPLAGLGSSAYPLPLIRHITLTT